MTWPYVGAVALALFLAACARSHHDAPDAGLPPQSPLALEVALAGQSAWADANLETAPRSTCLLDELRIKHSLAELGIAHADDFARLCPDAWACLGWQPIVVVGHRGKLVRKFAPVAYVSPALTEAMVPHQALHEWLHGAGYCSGRWGGWFDAGHTDRAVWYVGGAWSAEQRGQRLLDDAPEPDPPMLPDAP